MQIVSINQEKYIGLLVLSQLKTIRENTDELLKCLSLHQCLECSVTSINIENIQELVYPVPPPWNSDCIATTLSRVQSRKHSRGGAVEI